MKVRLSKSDLLKLKFTLVIHYTFSQIILQLRMNRKKKPRYEKHHDFYIEIIESIRIVFDILIYDILY